MPPSRHAITDIDTLLFRRASLPIRCFDATWLPPCFTLRHCASGCHAEIAACRLMAAAAASCRLRLRQFITPVHSR